MATDSFKLIYYLSSILFLPDCQTARQAANSAPWGYVDQTKLYRSFWLATSFIAVLAALTPSLSQKCDLAYKVCMVFVGFCGPCALLGMSRVAWGTIASAYLRGALEKFMVFNFDQVHNYFERLVFEDVARKSEAYPDFTMDMLGDVACVALNRLPARYVRHDVDMMFYLTEQERHAIELSMDEALQFAFGFVQERAVKTAR
jgi:hypothetical protein